MARRTLSLAKPAEPCLLCGPRCKCPPGMRVIPTSAAQDRAIAAIAARTEGAKK